MKRRAGFVLGLAAAIALALLAWRVGGVRFGAEPPAVVSADAGLQALALAVTEGLFAWQRHE